MSAGALESRPAMPADFVAPFIASTLNVLQTMASIQATPGQPHPKAEVLPCDITGVMGLTAPGEQGAFAIGFSEACILRVVSNMLGEEVLAIDAGVEDAVGELTNMISGGARAALDRRGRSFRMALPTVISHRAHRIISASTPWVVQFETVAGPFFTEVCLAGAAAES